MPVSLLLPRYLTLSFSFIVLHFPIGFSVCFLFLPLAFPLLAHSYPSLFTSLDFFSLSVVCRPEVGREIVCERPFMANLYLQHRSFSSEETPSFHPSTHSSFASSFLHLHCFSPFSSLSPSSFSSASFPEGMEIAVYSLSTKSMLNIILSFLNDVICS